MKTSLETVHEVLSTNELEPAKIQKILRDIEAQAAAEAEEAKANREPVQKKQFVAILYDADGMIATQLGPERVDSLVCTVLQIPEDDQPALVTEKLIRASYEFNISKRGRKHPVKTIGEACEAVPIRFLREQDLAVKTRIPVQVVVTDNRIPQEVAQ